MGSGPIGDDPTMSNRSETAGLGTTSFVEKKALVIELSFFLVSLIDKWAFLNQRRFTTSEEIFNIFFFWAASPLGTMTYGTTKYRKRHVEKER